MSISDCYLGDFLASTGYWFLGTSIMERIIRSRSLGIPTTKSQTTNTTKQQQLETSIYYSLYYSLLLTSTIYFYYFLKQRFPPLSAADRRPRTSRWPHRRHGSSEDSASRPIAGGVLAESQRFLVFPGF